MQSEAAIMLKLTRLVKCIVVWFIIIHVLESAAEDPTDDGVKKIEIKKGISLAFAIDTTYSMTDDIEGTREGAEAIMKLVQQRDHYPIVNFVLSTFNDPDPPILFKTHSKQIFRQKLSELKVTGPNMDCPELAMGGIKLAIENSLENSVVYVFTDAAAKDVYMAEEVRNLANLKKVEITFLLTGDCGDGRNAKNYEIYGELAKDTNGVVYNLGSKNSVAEVLTYVGESLDERTRVLAYSPVAGKGKNTHVDVDETMKAFTVTLNGRDPKVKITDPSGDEADESRILVKLNLSETLVVEIVDPEPGRWNIKSITDAAVIVKAVSNISFKTGFSFKPVTRFSDTIKEPVIGKLTVLTVSPIAEKDNDIWTPTIAQIVDIDEKPLEDPLILSPIPGPEIMFKTPPFLTPEKTFNIAVSGYDKAGNPIKRITKVPIRISMEVLDPPTSSVTSIDVVATAKDNLELKCKVEGKKLSLGWYKDTHPLYESDKYHFSDDYRTLTIARMGNPNDAGKYECVGVNPSGQAVETHHVLFESIDIQEGADTVYQNVYENTRIELSCSPIGFFNPSVRWDFNGIPMDPTGEKLFLENIQKSDNGTYRCIVQNDRKQLKTKNYVINVIVPNWSDWAAWSTCSKSCGTGMKFRRRSCILPGLAPGSLGRTVETIKCGIESMDMGYCNYAPCEVDGGWTEWSEWSFCSRTCGKGEQKRFRLCENPKPAFGGSYCRGHNSERKGCLISNCEFDGGWSDWSEWSSCSVVCGGGSRLKTRTCTNPPPSSGGAGCRGSNERYESCNTEPCKVDGGWSDWDDWSECSNKCGSGFKYSRRNCTNPVPQNGGRYCAGPDRKSEVCEKPCLPEKLILEISSLINYKYSAPVNVSVKLSDELGNKKLSFSTPDVIGSKSTSSPIWPFILSAASWLVAHENDNSTNGFTLTRGQFFQTSTVRFDTGESVQVKHRGMGLIDNGTAVFIKVNANGKVPMISFKFLRKLPPLDKTLMQLGPGEIYIKHQTAERTGRIDLNYRLTEIINYNPELGYMANKLQQLHSVPRKIFFNKRLLSDKNVLTFATEASILRPADNSCPDGYVDELGKYCQDIDECALNRDKCSHECVNKMGSYECLCPERMELEDDYNCIDDEGFEGVEDVSKE